MTSYYLILLIGVVSFIIGSICAVRREVASGFRFVGGLVALVSLVVLIYLWTGSRYGNDRQYRAANQRQGYASGYGLGQFLKQTQSGRQIAVLRTIPESERSAQAFDGLKDGLDGKLKIVVERKLDISKAEDIPGALKVYTKELMVELKQNGAEIVVSFLPLSMRFDLAGVFDLPATRKWWQSPEYSALQWTFPYPPDPSYPWPPGAFREARVLAFVREKPLNIPAKGFPPQLKIKGTPAELFNAWFELITKDEGE